MLNAAEAVIGRIGHSATLDEIAAEAGVTKPVLYDRIGGRTQLADQLADRMVARLIAHVTPDDLATTGWVRAVITATVGALQNERELFLYVTHSHTPDASHRLGLASRSAQPLVRLLLESGRVDDAQVATAWAHAIVGMLNMAVLWSAESDMTSDALIAALIDLAENGIGT